MDLYPAIDLRDGRVVRLLRGDYGAETVYDDHPVTRAKAFADAGARWVHVVDLDAARTGEPANVSVIESICGAVYDGCGVEASGGVRSIGAAERLFDAGVARVVVGTAAIETPDLVDALTGAWPGRVAVGLDVRGREVAVRGWTEGTGIDVAEVVRRFDGGGVAALEVTQIQRDGTFAGPDVDLYADLLALTSLPVVASGGVGSLEDLHALAAVEVGGRRLAGAIVGKALYEGRFDLEEALSACSQSA